MINEMTENQKAYIAGIIDGEGCISIQVTRPTRAMRNPFYGLICVVASTDYILMEWLQKTTGIGRIHKRPTNPGNRRPAWSYVLTTNQARVFLEEILPFLIIKREQALLGIEFQRYGKIPGEKPPIAEIQQKRKWYVDKLKELKRPDETLT